jgi:hypothetical protein
VPKKNVAIDIHVHGYLVRSVNSSDHETLRAEVACMAKQAKGVEEAMHHGDATEHHDVDPFVVEGRDIGVVVVLSHVPQPVVAHNGEDNSSHPCT